MQRCEWANLDSLYIDYHDQEWGVPVHEDRALFEMLVLGGVQAGLSWVTVLRKRQQYRRVFDNFQPAVVAHYNEAKFAALMADAGIVRNRQKISSAIQNARAVLRIQNTFGSFNAYLWQFVGGQTIHHSWQVEAELPTFTPQAEAMSADLKQHGFSFVGPTICYAFMQSVGMVNDHVISCFRHAELKGE